MNIFKGFLKFLICDEYFWEDMVKRYLTEKYSLHL